MVRCCVRHTVFLLLVCAVFARAADPGSSTALDRVARWAHGPSFGVDVASDLLLVGEGSMLRVFDAADPMHGVFLGEIELPGVVMEIDRVDDFAYVAAARGGLRIVDLTDPTEPALRGGLFTPGTAYAVTVEGTRAVLGDLNGGLRIYDVADPDAPVELGAYEVDIYASDVDVVGTIAYVADMNDSAMEVYDISDPAGIVLLGHESLSGPPWGVSVDGGLAVVVDDYAGIGVIDVSTAASPTEVGHAWMNDVGYDVELRGTTAYVAEDWRGLSVYDLAGLPSISMVGTYDTPGAAFGLSVIDDLVFVADRHEGVWPIDMSVPSVPVLGDRIGPVGPLRKVTTKGGVSYVIDEAHGLRILQPLADGGAMQLSVVELAGSPQRVDVEDDIAYVACSTAGVAVVDVADPRHPDFVRWIEIPDYLVDSRAMGLSVDEGRLGVVDQTSGFYLFDVSDPSDPIERGSYFMGTEPRNVIVDGAHAYVADYNLSIRVLELDPVVDQVGEASHIGYNHDLDLHGSILFVAKLHRGVWMVDVSDPLAPTDVYTLGTVGSANDISVAWPYLYVAEGSALRSYDVRFPTSPEFVGEYVVDDVTLGVSAHRQRIHVAGMFGGWYELENTLVAVAVEDPPPTQPVLSVDAPRPNPFNPRSTLRFAIAVPGAVRVSIVDARGRVVAVLIDDRLPVGPHEAVWDGTDARGVGVASGVYRFRVEAVGRAQTRGVALVR